MAKEGNVLTLTWTESKQSVKEKKKGMQAAFCGLLSKDLSLMLQVFPCAA